MFARLLPHEGDFFVLFSRHAELMVTCARELSELIARPAEARRARSSRREDPRDRGGRGHSRDDATAAQDLRTPLDRDDIHQPDHRMDDILDLMEDVAQLVVLYDLREIPEEGRRLGDLCVRCTEEVRAAVDLLSSLKEAEQIMRLCHRIDQLETEADHVMRAAIARLFQEEADAGQLIKVKEMVELLEAVTDRCEDVANIIEGIVLENG